MNKKDLIKNPQECFLDVTLPKEIDSLKKLHKYFQENFLLDIDLDSKSDNYQNIFYNADLRSFCGQVWDEFENPIRIWMQPKYFCTQEDIQNNTRWAQTWKKLIKQSKIVKDKDA